MKLKGFVVKARVPIPRRGPAIVDSSPGLKVSIVDVITLRDPR